MDAPARQCATDPVAEEQLAVLREEIRRTGQAGGVLVFGAVGIVLLLLLAGVGVIRLMPFWPGIFLLGPLAVAIAAGVLFGLEVRSTRVRSVRRQLADLNEQDRARVLRPLQSVGGDTSLFVAQLLRDLGLPSELTPAGSPEGSGAEVSGVAHPSGEG